MSIKVKEVIKLYHNQRALDGISFEIPRGEIVGFLGPNGAGKSTMMKIITGFIPPSQGDVWVNGMNVRTHSMEIRRNIGYLPEHNPLYHSMYVKEYLGYVAGLYRLGASRMRRVDEMIELTGLGVEQHKKIEALSKGYRQRVGLAQALIHDPEVLILDEPTTGLDPNQLVEVRKLIKEIGKDKTVMLSTHIMQEVEAICERVIIINKGKLVADGAEPTLLSAKGNLQEIEIEFQNSIDVERWRQQPWVDDLSVLEGNRYILMSRTKEDVRSLIFHFAADNSHVILEQHPRHKSMEQIFREMTGK